MPVTESGPTLLPIDTARLEALLAGSRWTVELSQANPSTNATAAERARADAPEGLVVLTEHQTAGRGRLDRTWVTPPRSALTMSLLLRPQASMERWPWLPLLTGYAVRAGLRTAGVAADLKWPNDVLVGDRKIAGILLERVDTPSGPAAITGIGLNTGLTREDLPVSTATSVLLETGSAPDRTALLASVLEAMAEQYDRWSAGSDALPAAYQEACTTLDQRVRVELPTGGVLVGVAEGIDASGRLLVQSADRVVAVGAGDVVHVRRTDAVASETINP